MISLKTLFSLLKIFFLVDIFDCLQNYSFSPYLRDWIVIYSFVGDRDHSHNAEDDVHEAVHKVSSPGEELMNCSVTLIM